MEGALVPEVEAQQQTNSHQNFPTGRRREYLQSTQPGARLPHFPIRMFCLNPPATSKVYKFSPLDCFSPCCLDSDQQFIMGDLTSFYKERGRYIYTQENHNCRVLGLGYIVPVIGC